MKRWKILVVVGAVALLALCTVGLALARGPAAIGPRNGVPLWPRQTVAGVIVSIQDNTITLQTARGDVAVTVNDATVYRMAPAGAVTLADVQQAVQDAANEGAEVRATILAEKSGDALVALTVSVLPPLPAITHFVGTVTAIEGNTVTATNAAGETMTVTLPDAGNVKIGQQIVLGIGPGPVMQKGVQGFRLGVKQQVRNFVQGFRFQVRPPLKAPSVTPPGTGA